MNYELHSELVKKVIERLKSDTIVEYGSFYSRPENGKIYKLYSLVDDKFYIGSTMQDLNARLAQHISKNSIAHFRDVIGWDNVLIEMVKECPCQHELDLRKWERIIIMEQNPTLNKAPPFSRYTNHLFKELGRELDIEAVRELVRTTKAPYLLTQKNSTLCLEIGLC